jgi:DNA-binding IclR family transcriptional regulator
VTLAPTQLLDEVADLAVRRPITNADVRRHTGLDRQQALHVLQVLVRQGRLRQVGERRTSHYLSTGMLGESS